MKVYKTMLNKDGENEKATVFYPPTALGRIVLCMIFAAALIVLGIWSCVDTDKTVSEAENRNLSAKPKFSVSALYNKSYTSDFDSYYADTFPLRDYFLSVSQKVSKIMTGTKGTDEIVLVEKQEKDDFAGQDINYDE